MPQVRIALMGAGWIGREHVGLVARNPDTRLVAIADVSTEAEDLAAAHGAAFHPTV
jgi:predicted dehydrogenase